MTESNGQVAIETLILLGLRFAYFVSAQQYLQRSLYSDLRQVIREETSSTAGALQGDSSLQGSGPATVDDSDDPVTPLTSNGNGQSLREQLSHLRGGPNSSSSVLLPHHSGTSITAFGRVSPSTSRRRSGSGNSTRATQQSSAKQTIGLARRVSSAIFCTSVSECMTLFTLLLFGNIVGERARLLNWNISLTQVLALIVLIIPLGMLFLFSMRSKAVSASIRRILVFTALPFAAWIAGLFTIGNWLSDLVGIKEGTDIGMLGITLDRLCVPGTVLIAALSGGAAVNSAWEAFIWRERFRSNAVTEGHVNAAARSLAQMRNDLAARQAEIDALKSSLSDSSGDQHGFFSRVFGSSPHASKIKSLQGEIAGLSAMESQMSQDLQLLRRRKEISELSKTWTGFTRQAVGYIFSIYCVYRIIISCVNLLFGHYFSDDGGSSGKRRPPSDFAGAIFSYFANAFGWDIDVHTWSKIAGLILVGSIIMANLNFVLGYVSRVFRATSAGNSASFMLLFLSQLMAVYLITSLISLPQSDEDTQKGAAPLLATLPDFRVFSRIFDAVFLTTAVVVLAVRWIHRKVAVSEQLGLDDFVP